MLFFYYFFGLAYYGISSTMRNSASKYSPQAPVQNGDIASQNEVILKLQKKKRVELDAKVRMDPPTGSTARTQ